MSISFVEISNFGKLKSARIDFDKESTIFVGANKRKNFGDGSAWLLVAPGRLSLRDTTISNWPKIDALGSAWEGDSSNGAS